jgi:hypothetical protein
MGAEAEMEARTLKRAVHDCLVNFCFLAELAKCSESSAKAALLILASFCKKAALSAEEMTYLAFSMT